MSPWTIEVDPKTDYWAIRRDTLWGPPIVSAYGLDELEALRDAIDAALTHRREDA